SAEICDNIDNNCDGTTDSFPTSCGVGACARTGTCTAGSNSCAPGSPSAEICDNIDNNCDGTIDTVLPPAGALVLTVTKTNLSWTSAPNAGRYDITRGNL